jgi:acyl carrier protein phosphodiesterase
MNFIISIYLSRHLSSPDRILGAFVGEFVKAPVDSDSEISQGICFSNRIFDFIKTHPSFNKTRRRINFRYLKLQEEFVLLCYSHFLSVQWKEYSSVNWESSLRNTCIILSKNWEHIPYKLRTILPTLISNNEILKIDTMSGLDNYLKELASKRFIGRKIKDALQDLLGNYTSIKKDFEDLMPDLDQYIKQLLALEETENSPAVLANAS